MEIYYDISELLDLIEDGPDTPETLNKLIPVYKNAPPCNGYKEDAFVLTSAPKLLDLTNDSNVTELAELVEKTPLYQINMELVLDDALYERHRNNVINNALEIAFEGEMPNTLEVDRNRKESSGSLHHPMLGHVDRRELVRLYMRFMKALARNKRDYSFEDKILGKHTDRFTAIHNGFLTANGGAVKASLLLGFAARQDHETGKPLESYVENGKAEARKMKFGGFKEMIWAWLEMENFQSRRCHDLDRVLSIKSLDRTPRWISTDIFMMLEKEAIKQYLGELIMQTPEAAKAAESAPKLFKAVERAKLGDVNKNIQILLSQTLGQERRYAGSAGAFAKEARERATEARNLAI